MKFRLLSVGAAAAVAAAVIPVHAASGAHKPQIVDPAGDANAINDEGIGSPFPNVPSTSTPADDSAADIRSVLFQTTFKKHHKKKVVTGSTVTLTLSAAPQPQTMYRVIVKSVSCDLQIFL